MVNKIFLAAFNEWPRSFTSSLMTDSTNRIHKTMVFYH